MGFALSSCQGCQAALCHPWGHWGQLHGCLSTFLLESQRQALLGGGQALRKRGSVAALWLLLAEPVGSRRAPEAAQLQAGTAGCVELLGGRGGAGPCPLHLWCPQCQGWQGQCSVAGWEQIHVPGSCSCCGLSPHGPGAGTELGMGLSRGPGQPAWAAKPLDGFRMDGGCSRMVLLLAGGF